jgi:hypothetical protein
MSVTSVGSGSKFSTLKLQHSFQLVFHKITTSIYYKYIFLESMLILNTDGWDQGHCINFSDNQLKYERIDECTVILTNGTIVYDSNFL